MCWDTCRMFWQIVNITFSYSTHVHYSAPLRSVWLLLCCCTKNNAIKKYPYIIKGFKLSVGHMMTRKRRRETKTQKIWMCVHAASVCVCGLKSCHISFLTYIIINQSQKSCANHTSCNFHERREELYVVVVVGLFLLLMLHIFPTCYKWCFCRRVLLLLILLFRRTIWRRGGRGGGGGRGGIRGGRGWIVERWW